VFKSCDLLSALLAALNFSSLPQKANDALKIKVKVNVLNK
jgi:hypothetical protein